MSFKIKAFLFCFLLIVCLLSCKSLWYNIPDLTDYRIFPNKTICPDTSNQFFFKYANHPTDLGKKIRLNDKPLRMTVVSLDEYLKVTNSAAFLIIRNDSVLYEYYSQKNSPISIFNTFSITKAFVSALIGIAISEGKIKNSCQYICDFLPELKGKGYDSIKIKHLLKHTSGIDFTDNPLNVFSDNEKYYYGKQLRKMVFKHKVIKTPGTFFHYSSVNTQLLGIIIERATKTSLSKYLEEKIWKKIGMQYNALWSLDNNSAQSMEKAFCCLNCRTIDLAKFGRLFLNKGKWNGKEIIPESWIMESTKRDSSDAARWDYKYNWGIGPKLYESFFAVGVYGQLIYVYPKKNVIIVKITESTINYNPTFLYHSMIQIIDQL